MSGGVTPAARRRDATAVSILVVGLAVALYGYVGLHAMATRPIAHVPGQLAMARAVGYNQVLYARLGIVTLGICAALGSTWPHHREARLPVR